MNEFSVIAGIHEIAYYVLFGSAEIEVLDPLDTFLCDFYCQLRGNSFDLRRLKVAYQDGYVETETEKLELKRIMLEILDAVLEQKANHVAETTGGRP
jgi:hypothetical protein